jgi:carboxymethylenebutenolidase
MGTTVVIGRAGTSGRGYLAEPAAPGPGVLVVHDWFGFLPHVRERCDELAAAGLVALAPDLFNGSATTELRRAMALFDALDIEDARSALSVAARQLRAHPKVRPKRIGAVGFAMGGWLALLTATTGVLDAVVGYSAALEPAERAPIRCPVLLHLAEIDDWDPPDAPTTFIRELSEAGGVAEARVWPGTRHSFANTDLPGHSPEAARAAWADTIEFLSEHLRR